MVQTIQIVLHETGSKHLELKISSTIHIQCYLQWQSSNSMAIGLTVPVFNGLKLYTMSPEQWIQRVKYASQAERWTNEQTIGFSTTA